MANDESTIGLVDPHPNWFRSRVRVRLQRLGSGLGFQSQGQDWAFRLKLG